ncbi:MAG: DUF488 family protein [Candidatus Micrarchaeota archaeon]|nr:DUF488 family protein [Candidatus Micrarchaeota archaeon]
MILVKRVYEKFYITDGVKILVDRLWPRGIRRNTPNVDIWIRNVAPSHELRKWYMHDPKKWVEFRSRYLKELEGNKAALKLLSILQSTDPVTFVYATIDEKHNSAIVLQRYMEKLLSKAPKVEHPVALHPHRTRYDWRGVRY